MKLQATGIEFLQRAIKRAIWLFLDAKTYTCTNGDFLNNSSPLQAIYSYRRWPFNWTTQSKDCNIFSSVKYVNTTVGWGVLTLHLSIPVKCFHFPSSWYYRVLTDNVNEDEFKFSDEHKCLFTMEKHQATPDKKYSFLKQDNNCCCGILAKIFLMLIYSQYT